MPTTTLRLLLAATVLALGLAACGGGDDGARDTFVAALSEDGQITADQAGCVYDRLSEDLDEDQVAALADLDVEPDDPAVSAAAVAAFEACFG